jgi:hypothetical protein
MERVVGLKRYYPVFDHSRVFARSNSQWSKPMLMLMPMPTPNPKLTPPEKETEPLVGSDILNL